VESTIAVKLTPDDSRQPCERCGESQDIVELAIIQGHETESTPGMQTVVHLCASCLADGVERATGFRAVRQLENWRHMRRVLGKGQGRGAHGDTVDSHADPTDHYQR